MPHRGNYSAIRWNTFDSTVNILEGTSALLYYYYYYYRLLSQAFSSWYFA